MWQSIGKKLRAVIHPVRDDGPIHLGVAEIFRTCNVSDLTRFNELDVNALEISVGQ
jgi:hypothetical protein